MNKYNNEQKTFKLLSLVLSIAYFIFVVILIFYFVNIPQTYNKREKTYIYEAELGVKDLLDHIDHDKEERLSELVNKYPMEIVVENAQGEIILKTLNVIQGNYMGTINENVVLQEAEGQYQTNEEIYNFWFVLYTRGETGYIQDFFVNLSIIIGLLMALLTILVFIYGRALLKPLMRARRNISKLEEYDFENIERPKDNVNKDLALFADKLETNIDTASKTYSSLKKELEIEKERLDNTVIVSRSFIHDLKTPILHNILENEQQLEKSNVDADLIVKNIEMNQKLMHRINEVLKLMDSDFYDVKKSVSQIDLVNIMHQCLETFSKAFKQGNYSLELSVPDQLVGYYNAETMKLIIHNLISNMVKYAKNNTELSIYMGIENNKLIMKFTNECERIDLQRMMRSENLLSATEIFNEKNNKSSDKYSSDNGLFLIKDLTAMMGGQYYLDTVNDTVTITILLPWSEHYE